VDAALARFLPADMALDEVAAVLGLISDTHAPERCLALPPAIFEILRGVDLVLHAGDVGRLWVLDQLSSIAPIVAVHGNDETAEAQQVLPYQQVIVVAGQRILLTHAHYPDRAEELAARRDERWEPKLERRALLGRLAGASIVVFGHIHVPMVRGYDGVLLVNPGAIAAPNYVSRQSRQTVALLFLRRDGPPQVAHIDLAAPERPFVPIVDWEAGFRAAHDQYTASILAPALAHHWQELQRLFWPASPGAESVRGPDHISPLRAALLRQAHRCWTGEQPSITGAELLREIQGDPAIFPDERRQVTEAWPRM
jgi:putative phosphoesterase